MSFGDKDGKHDEYKWLNEVGSQSLQMALRSLDNAFTKFFKKQDGYPKYKTKKHSYQSFTAPQNIKIANNRVYLPKFTKDGIKLKYHREIPKNAILKQATISRHFIKSQNRLKRLQRRLSKKQKGSKNNQKAKLRVQKLHTKIFNKRRDYLHKISNEITNQYDIVCVETLKIKGMIRNKHLAKSIADVAWSEFIRQLEYKSIWRGKTLLKIDKWFPSSQICSNCGANSGKKPLHIRKWTCKECGYTHNRDLNAAINIRNYGLGQIDNRNTAGTVAIKACGVPSGEVTTTYGVVASYGSMKQEAQSSLTIG